MKVLSRFIIGRLAPYESSFTTSHSSVGGSSAHHEGAEVLVTRATEPLGGCRVRTRLVARQERAPKVSTLRTWSMIFLPLKIAVMIRTVSTPPSKLFAM